MTGLLPAGTPYQLLLEVVSWSLLRFFELGRLQGGPQHAIPARGAVAVPAHSQVVVEHDLCRPGEPETQVPVLRLVSGFDVRMRTRRRRFEPIDL
jgi:hypothetical protein